MSKHLPAQSIPIAIVGIGCRFPGKVSGWQQYWDFLSRGGDGICEVPPDRWDLARYYSPSRKPGNLYVRKGGFLSDVDRYDAAFFGISPREAAHLDPQQRLLLEVAWKRVERSYDLFLTLACEDPGADPLVGPYPARKARTAPTARPSSSPGLEW